MRNTMHTSLFIVTAPIPTEPKIQPRMTQFPLLLHIKSTLAVSTRTTDLETLGTLRKKNGNQYEHTTLNR